jgi:hypothetical protein
VTGCDECNLSGRYTGRLLGPARPRDGSWALGVNPAQTMTTQLAALLIKDGTTA